MEAGVGGQEEEVALLPHGGNKGCRGGVLVDGGSTRLRAALWGPAPPRNSSPVPRKSMGPEGFGSVALRGLLGLLGDKLTMVLARGDAVGLTFMPLESCFMSDKTNSAQPACSPLSLGSSSRSAV